ncbi:trifunctional serine/threonine-protein kinase/ATP-binding protein/sensor histidine kinase [Segnochrobactrum spirostomi]|nr:ATP-binding sensor histidine kinase [Segnochrobactrum spirostomi]
MNSTPHVDDVSREDIAAAPRSAHLLSNALASRLGTKELAWWSGLEVGDRSTEAGIDLWHVTDMDGREWRIRLADWNSAAADRLQFDASLALTLGDELTEVPLFIGEHNRLAQKRLALVYPARTARALADLPHRAIDVAEFLRLAVDATGALARMHAAGIIHGRLTPARVLIEPDGRVRFVGLAWAAAAAFGSSHDRRLTLRDMAYAAPELIRTDAAPVDTRTDLYAIGVLLYQLIVGSLPLTAGDAAGWLHAHVAMEAPPARLARPDVPVIVDRILSKLLSKDPKLRYQTAKALHADFKRVFKAFAAGVDSEPFELARGEFAEPSLSSPQFIGRRSELKALADLYADFLTSTHRGIALVSGEAGAGKSTLVEALLADLRGGSVICASGKGVELRQGTPFAPIAQALRLALAQLTGGDERRLEDARARLGSVVGCGRVLAELVPEANILPAIAHRVADVPAHLAQARSARILAETLAALATADMPLLLFLDDLQWFDQGSLNVFSQLCGETPAHVFLVASFRSEAADRKAVRDSLGIARSSSAFSGELKLLPISERDTNELVALFLKSPPDEVQPIAAVIHREAHGNPFYIGQLLRRSLDEEVLHFDSDRQEWIWSERRRRHQSEIAGLMLERINDLPPLQRNFLQRCASLGGRCTPIFVAELSDANLEETVRAANALVAAGLLRRSGADFAIAHDRVLEAAYAAMPAGARARIHLGNARLLAASNPAPDPDRAFEIASQIERSDLDMLTAEERPRFAEILLRAARSCRTAGEAPRALHFVELIRRILPGTRPDAPDALVFESEWLQCDCLLALGRVDEALAALEDVSPLAHAPVSIADIFRLRAIAFTLKGSYALAIDAAVHGLRALDIELETSADPAVHERAYRRCRDAIDSVGRENLTALPEMSDRRMRAALSLLSTMISSFFVEGPLRFLHVVKIVELTLSHGTAPESTYGLAWFGVLSAHHYGAYQRGVDYAMVAGELAQRDGYEAQRTAALIALDQVSAWTVPMRTALGYARDGARVGQAAGDLGMACYARNHIASDMLVVGDHLDRIRTELVSSIAMTRDVGYRDIELILTAQINLVDTLIHGDPLAEISDADLREGSVATQFWAKHYAGVQTFFAGNLEAARVHLAEAEVMAWAAPAHIDTANNCFFLALAEARLHREDLLPVESERRIALARERFNAWAALNPETFSSKHLMLEADAARLEGRRSDAMDLYERAAAAAGSAKFVHDQALAQELAAQLYLESGLNAAAQGCLQSAVYHYRQWGAHGKAARLGEHLLPLSGFEGTKPAPESLQSELDLTVMTAASQTLAEEVGLEQVVRTLMKSMLVHAGAQFGLLVLLRDGDPAVEAVARVRNKEVEIELQPSAKPEDLMPASVLKTVLRTARPVTLADATVEAAQRGLTMGSRSIRSLACLPLIKRGELIGILYLENALSVDVFTPRRMAMLEVLAPQAAISLDAARLYADLLEENLRRVQAEFELREARSDLARANQITAMGSLATSIAHEINQPLASLIAQADAGLRWLNRSVPDLGEVESSLRSVREAGRRAADIIAALRSLVKQEPSTLAPAFLDDILADVLKIASTDLAPNGVQIHLDLSAEKTPVMANQTQVQQLLFNIITNAVQSMVNKDPSERHLMIRSSASENEVEIAIEDSGCGMPQEVISRIFQPFFTTKRSGMGVGLAICRSIVEMHGGSLEARSVEGKGSTFFIRLPVAAA